MSTKPPTPEKTDIEVLEEMIHGMIPWMKGLADHYPSLESERITSKLTRLGERLQKCGRDHQDILDLAERLSKNPIISSNEIKDVIKVVKGLKK